MKRIKFLSLLDGRVANEKDVTMKPEHALIEALNLLTGDLDFSNVSEEEYLRVLELIESFTDASELLRMNSENAIKRNLMMPFSSLNGK